METIAENIQSFFKSFNSSEIKSFVKLPQSGGDRIYFRIVTEDKSYIATYNEYVYELFKKSLKALAWLQIEGNTNLDYNFCITSQEFGKQAIMSDLLYFK